MNFAVRSLWLVLLCLTVLPAHAQDVGQRLVRWSAQKYDNFTARRAQRVGPWALVELTLKQDQSPARLLFRHHDRGGWFLIPLQRRGYDLDAQDLFEVGVLMQDISKLLNRGPLSPAESSQLREHLPYSLGLDSLSLDSQKDFSDGMCRDPWSLMLLRNELFARHGRVFQDPELRAIFSQRGWYRPDASYSDARLSARQAANVKALLRWEKRFDAQAELVPDK